LSERNRISIHRPSSVKVEAVFILTIKNEKGEIEFKGTAFAVTPKKAVTCYHHFNDYKNTEIILTNSVDIDGDGVTTLPPRFFSVNLISSSESDDWAVLEIPSKDPDVFRVTIPICRNLPVPSSNPNSGITVFYVPLGIIDEGKLPKVGVWNEVTFLLQLEDKTAVFQFGRTRGCSGSPYVDHNGEVIAYHIECLNEYKVVTSAPSTVEKRKSRTKKTKSEGKRLEVKISHLSKHVDSVSQESGSTHANYSIGNVISRLPALLEAIGQ
jgi:hypothetical protein